MTEWSSSCVAGRSGHDPADADNASRLCWIAHNRQELCEAAHVKWILGRGNARNPTSGHMIHEQGCCARLLESCLAYELPSKASGSVTVWCLTSHITT